MSQQQIFRMASCVFYDVFVNEPKWMNMDEKWHSNVCYDCFNLIMSLLLSFRRFCCQLRRCVGRFCIAHILSDPVTFKGSVCEGCGSQISKNVLCFVRCAMRVQLRTHILGAIKIQMLPR